MNEIPRELRHSLYWLLIVLSLGGLTGRILAVNAVDRQGLENDRVQREVAARQHNAKQENQTVDAQAIADEVRGKLRLQRPFLSANDRSRWGMVRAIVERGTFAIDDIVTEPGWDTIDMVKHPDRDGVEHLYSSKPPLFALIMAGEYWTLHKLTGWTLGDHPFELGRFMVWTLNVLPLIVYFWALAYLIDRLALTDFGRLVAMATATCGTFLSTFGAVVNNHLHAAVCVALVAFCWGKIVLDGDRRWRTFALAGLAAGFAFSFELPALGLVVVMGCLLLRTAPRLALVGFAPMAAAVIAAVLGTNYWVHGSIREPYSHRILDASGTRVSDVQPDNWYNYTFTKDGRERRSYWLDPQGIDRGEASPGRYLLHATIGHHGIFSLTPIWILSWAGMLLALKLPRWRELAAGTLFLSLVCLAFYCFGRPQLDRNYGGMTSGLRWMFWFAPLWIVTALPAIDRLARSRWGRGLVLGLLGLSVMSASYPTWNPWVQPWLTQFMLYLDWIRFD